VSDFDKLAREFGEAADGLSKEVGGIVSKGALNIKRQVQKDFRGSSHFKAVDDIHYNRTVRANDIEAVIGPHLDSEGFGSLVGIAIHGGSRGGGGTVPDPILALRAEEPNFIKAAEDIVAKLLP
jgi:hypothetical protein